MTILYSILHFLVDGVCAFAMFGYFAGKDGWYLKMLLYNFCAFAMQMPLGVVLDYLNSQEKRRKWSPSYCFAGLGVLCTLAGALTHPVLLGLGNALFHLGGGVGTIYEDREKGWRGRGLGVFVAPGALGLYIGTQLGKSDANSLWLITVAVLMVAICLLGRRLLCKDVTSGYSLQESCPDERDEKKVPDLMAGFAETKNTGFGWLLFGCMSVVVLRSYIGMAVTFSWKTTLLAGAIAVLAVVLGKVVGGFGAVLLGTRRTMVISLGLAAVLYLLSANLVAGVLALFLFNMTMPITLYLLVERKREMPGFAFGALTFAIFLGILPEYLEWSLPVTGNIIGCVGSMISLVVLWFCIPKKPVTNDRTDASGEES